MTKGVGGALWSGGPVSDLGYSDNTDPMQAASSCSGGLVVSVVSHGHGPLVGALLQDLARYCKASVTRVVLTLNQADEPLPSHQLWPFEFQVRRNQQPLGFGANHNRALCDAKEHCVCVLNPDVRLTSDPFGALVAAVLQPGVGCAYPVQVDGVGKEQDSERALPTPAALWRRRILRHGEARVDWVNAACLVLPRTVWQQVGGFDERYFMYCEDVDLSLRIRLAGWAIRRVPVVIVHGGERASHRRLRYLLWHVRSLLRLWLSPVYRQAKDLLPLDIHSSRRIGPP